MVYFRKRAEKKSASAEAFGSPSRPAMLAESGNDSFPEAQNSGSTPRSVVPMQPNKVPSPPQDSASLSTGDLLVINSPDQFSVRLSNFEDGQIRGIQLRIGDYRLASIQRDRVVLSSACSFDGRCGAFRESCLSAQVFALPQAIRPGFRSNPILLVWKAPQWPGLVTG